MGRQARKPQRPGLHRRGVLHRDSLFHVQIAPGLCERDGGDVPTGTRHADCFRYPYYAAADRICCGGAQVPEEFWDGAEGAYAEWAFVGEQR